MYSADDPHATPVDLFDPQHPAHDVSAMNTDGTDLVWQETEYWYPNGPSQAPSVEVEHMHHAPYSLDPQQLLAHRQPMFVRPYEMSTNDIGVGCGRAICTSVLRNNGGGVIHRGLQVNVVRLADGHRWTIPLTDGRWDYGAPVYVSCEEMILRMVHVTTRFEDNFVRVRFDALGPGTAPE